MSKGADPETDGQPSTETDQIPWDDIPAETQRELLNLADASRAGEASRRDVLAALAGGGVAGAALGGGAVYGTSQPASAGHGGGSVGTNTNPVDVFAAAVNGGGPVIDGDGTEREVYVIAAGASDPTGADPEDIIFEEET